MQVAPRSWAIHHSQANRQVRCFFQQTWSQLTSASAQWMSGAARRWVYTVTGKYSSPWVPPHTTLWCQWWSQGQDEDNKQEVAPQQAASHNNQEKKHRQTTPKKSQQDTKWQITLTKDLQSRRNRNIRMHQKQQSGEGNLKHTHTHTHTHTRNRYTKHIETRAYTRTA